MCPPQIHVFTGTRPLGQTPRSAPTDTRIVSPFLTTSSARPWLADLNCKLCLDTQCASRQSDTLRGSLKRTGRACPMALSPDRSGRRRPIGGTVYSVIGFCCLVFLNHFSQAELDDLI